MGSSSSAQASRVLGPLALERGRRPVIGDGGGHDHHVRVRAGERLALHVRRGRRVDDVDTRRRRHRRFAASSVTSAPRRRASSARATPMRPDERLPTKRTASIGSRVPPALTSTCLPDRLVAVRQSSELHRAKISSGSAIRPRPTRPRPARPPRGRRARRRARAGARRSPAWPGAPTCARSSPARRRAARGARAPPRSAGCRRARAPASRSCSPWPARRPASRRASGAGRGRRPPAGARARGRSRR